MTTYSELTIVFNEDLEYSDNILFKISDTQSASFIDVTEAWRSVRSAPNQVTIGVPTAVIGERTAINFVQSFNLDYNSTNIYELVRTLNTVVIKSTNADLIFENGAGASGCREYELISTDQALDTDFRYTDCSQNIVTVTVPSLESIFVFGVVDPVVLPGNGTGDVLPGAYETIDVVFTYNNFTGTVFSITDIAILEADTDPCNNVKLSVTTSFQASNMTSPVDSIVTTNPFVFTYPRNDSSFNLTMIESGNTDTKTLYIPKLLASLVSAQVINTPSQIATVNVNLSPPLFQNQTINGVAYPLIFEYSLDNTVWQSSNSFTGLAIGTYTVYVRDNIGCSVSVPFEVTTFSPNLLDFDAVTRISNLNSIRFKEDAVFTNCGTRKLPTNTLSFEERDKRPDRSFVQLVQQCDILAIQMDSNYAVNTVKLVDCDGVETDLPVTKMTDNMNKSDVRDGTITSSGTGTIGVRFGDGRTYDPTSLLPNGSYNLGTLLMPWVNVGDYFNLQGTGWAQIINIVQPTDAIPFTVVYTSSPNNGFYTANQVIQVTSVYNVVDFERYQFSFSALLLTGDYYIKVTQTDANFDDKSYTSEWLNVKETQTEKHFLIDYYNSVNNEINYSTGIRHRIRIPYVLQLKWKPNNTQDLYVTDQNTQLLESRVREFYDFNAAPLPTAMAQKVVLALSLDRLFIDGQSYIMEGEPEAVPFGDTNLYQVKATLVKANYVFDSNSNIINQDLVVDGTPLAIIPNQQGMLFID